MLSFLLPHFSWPLIPPWPHYSIIIIADAFTSFRTPHWHHRRTIWEYILSLGLTPFPLKLGLFRALWGLNVPIIDPIEGSYFPQKHVVRYLLAQEAPPPVHPTRDIQWGWLALRVKAHYRKLPTKLSCSLLFSYIWETYAAIGNSYDCVVWTYLVFYPKSQTMFNATRKCWFLSLAHSCLPLSTTVCLCTSPSIQLTQAWPIPSISLIQFTNNVPLTPTLNTSSPAHWKQYWCA